MSAFTTTQKKENYCFGDPCSNAITTGLCANLHQNHPLCGPLSLKPPLKLVRHCKPACWAYGHRILRACNGRIQDVVVDKHISRGFEEKILGYWYHLVMKFYNEKNILQPCHVSIYIDGENDLPSDPTDFALRNLNCIRKKEFIEEHTINTLLELYE